MAWFNYIAVAYMSTMWCYLAIHIDWSPLHAFPWLCPDLWMSVFYWGWVLMSYSALMEPFHSCQQSFCCSWIALSRKISLHHIWEVPFIKVFLLYMNISRTAQKWNTPMQTTLNPYFMSSFELLSNTMALLAVNVSLMLMAQCYLTAGVDWERVELQVLLMPRQLFSSPMHVKTILERKFLHISRICLTSQWTGRKELQRILIRIRLWHFPMFFHLQCCPCQYAIWWQTARNDNHIAGSKTQPLIHCELEVASCHIWVGYNFSIIDIFKVSLWRC